MNHKKQHGWLLYLIIAFVACILWFILTYPQLSFINLSVDKNTALKNADNFLVQQGYDISKYKKVVVFRQSSSAALFLQRTIGTDKIPEFAGRHGIDLFYWAVRFYQPQQKEEFKVFVDSAKGRVIGFSHIIDTGMAKPQINKDIALASAVKFLKETAGFDPENFILKQDESHKFDKRVEYSFIWEKKDSRLIWKKDKESAKVTIKATVTGDEILSFEKNYLSVPNEFFREIESIKNLGNNLSTVVMPLKLIMLIAAIYFVIRCWNDFALYATRKFYFAVGLLSFALSLLGVINFYPELAYGYNTTVDQISFYWQTSMQVIVSSLFIAFIMIIPGMAGEALEFGKTPGKENKGLINYLRSTFVNREISSKIIVGYLAAVILLAIQALLFYLGRRYFGLWSESPWLSQWTSAYLPFLAALAFGLKASISEEFMYRMFGINWGEKIFRSIVTASIVFSIVWGLGHSNYSIFPMWFRGVEVALLGILLCIIYLRYGIVTVIVAHYLFDVFWMSAPYIFGKSNIFYFSSTLFILLIPSIYALTAYILNRSVNIRPLQYLLNRHQKFNAAVLKEYIVAHPELLTSRDKMILKKEIIGHGWDSAVVNTVIDDRDDINGKHLA